MNTYSSLPPPIPTPFLKKGNEISKKLRRGSNLLEKPRRRKLSKCKSHRKMGSFHFHFLLPLMVTDIAFRKYSLENLF